MSSEGVQAGETGAVKGFSHILVPVDFSDTTRKILDTAVRVLGDEGRITLLHVVEWLPVVQEGSFGVYAHRKDIDQIKALARKKLDGLAATRPGIDMTVKVREGKPATTILGAVDELEPDLIVMGTHGRSRLDHLLIGSVAERVVRKAPCAVLLARFDP